MSRRRKLSLLVLAALLLLALALPLAARFQGERSLDKAKAAFAAEVWPLAFESHYPPAIPPQLNAAHWARAGGEALLLTTEERAFLADVNAHPARDWAPEQLDRASSLLRQNQPALDLLHLMAGLSRSSFELDYAAGRAMAVPNLMTLLVAGDLLLAELRVALAEQRPQDALQPLRSLRSLARACQRESPLIFQLIGVVLEVRVWRGTADVVFAGLAEPAVLVELASPLLETTAAEQLRRAVGFEAAVLLATPAEQLVRELDLDSPLLVAGAPYLKDGADAQTLDYYRRVLALYPHTNADELIADEDDGPHGMPGFPASELRTVVGLEIAVERFKMLETMRTLASIALEARRTALAAGSYPQDLSAFDGARANPYDGGALTWRLEAGGGATLEAASVAERWSRLNPSRPERNRPLLRWQLPPLVTPGL